MAEIGKDGFGHYGTGSASLNFMESGPWAAAAGIGCNLPAWVTRTDGSLMLQTGTQDDNSRGATRYPLRASFGVVFLSVFFTCNQLPLNDNFYILSARDGSNFRLARLRLRSDGVIILLVPDASGDFQQIAATGGPVIQAQKLHHLEMQFDIAGGHFTLRVDDAGGAGTPVLDTAVAYHNDNVGGVSTPATMEQVCIGAGVAPSDGVTQVWFGDFRVWDASGTVNNDFQGDIRVATLFPNGDTATAGWTPRPRHKIGNGVLDNRAPNAAVSAASSTSTDLGSADFTIEGFFRFFALPAGGDKAQLFGKWDETNNKRSYQLYLGGPSLDSGYLTFRISTDGQAGTVAKVISFPWAPELDRWYHVAIVRASAEALLFIDGIQQGLPVADANTYYAGTEPTALGAQVEGTSNVIASTYFSGFVDEFRLSAGYARYTIDFTPTAVAFGRNVSDDPHFATVAWLSGFDNGVEDESSYGRLLVARNGAAMLTPDDGDFAYQTINHPTPQDDTFVEAPFIPATGVLSQSGAPTATKTVTVGTYGGGPTTAVYTWRAAVASAFDVKIGVTVQDSLANLVAAINLAAGAGTLYGTGTQANNDVVASSLPNGQMLATASVPGIGGNSIASSTNDPDGSWAHATLTGGLDIPGPSEFTFQHPPQETTIVKSVTIVARSFKSDAGTCNVQASFIGPEGTAAAGTDNPLATTANYYEDVFETDPDTGDPMSVTTVIGGKVKLNRTA